MPIKRRFCLQGSFQTQTVHGGGLEGSKTAFLVQTACLNVLLSALISRLMRENFRFVSGIAPHLTGLFRSPRCSISLLAFLVFLLPASSSYSRNTNGKGETVENQTAEGVSLPEDLEWIDFTGAQKVTRPVSLTSDAQGSLYVAESFRTHPQSLLRRNLLQDWEPHISGFQNLRDRQDFLQSHASETNSYFASRVLSNTNGLRFDDLNQDGQLDWRDMEVQRERIRVFMDDDQDGVADASAIYADGFNELLSGGHLGLLAHKKALFFFCSPDLWFLKDLDQDLKAEVKRSLHRGFGVRFPQDIPRPRGVAIGPDGRIYFSTGDGGSYVEHLSGKLTVPDSGAVFRCNPDGTGLEVFAWGLKDPGDLAFDAYGNLWTCDTAGPWEDSARWALLIEGGNSGWHTGWENLPNGGPWITENLWETEKTNSGAYLVPPIGHFHGSPAGLAYYPGTGLPARFRDRLFLCDRTNSVKSFNIEPQGAFYRIVETPADASLVAGVKAMDITFGTAGGVFVGESPLSHPDDAAGSGRILKIVQKESDGDQQVEETASLLSEELSFRPLDALAPLLSHPDFRVRLQAQFAMTDKGFAAAEVFAKVAKDRDRKLRARLHAIWGLGQLGRTYAPVVEPLIPLLEHEVENPEIQAQTARVLGENRTQSALDALMKCMEESNPRVRYFSALALGKIGDPKALPGVLEMIQSNNNRDPYLRHAGVQALAALSEVHTLLALSRDPSAAVRLAVLLALRSLERAEVSLFLYDSDPKLVLEAARAIHDVPISSALPRLATLIHQPDLSDPVRKRVINANFRLGKLENALDLITWAANPANPAEGRSEILRMIALWETPPPIDRVMGLWRPLPKRDPKPARIVLRSELPSLLAPSTDNRVQKATCKAVVALDLMEAGEHLVQIIRRESSDPDLMKAAREALQKLNHPLFKKLGEK